MDAGEKYTAMRELAALREENAQLKAGLGPEETVLITNENAALRGLIDRLEAKLARLEEHDVTHAGPCCVRDIRGVDILGGGVR